MAEGVRVWVLGRMSIPPSTLVLKVRDVLNSKVWEQEEVFMEDEMEDIEHLDAEYVGTEYGDCGHTEGIVCVEASTYAL